MPLRMAGKIQMVPLTVQPQHRQRMNATQNKRNLSLNLCTVFHARQLLQVGICLLYPHQQLGEMKSLCNGDSTCAQQWPSSHACSCHHPSAALEKWRQCIPQSHINGWWVTDAFIWPSADMIECWMACPNIKEEENVTAQSDALEVMHVMFFSQKELGLDHPMPISMIVCTLAG